MGLWPGLADFARCGQTPRFLILGACKHENSEDPMYQLHYFPSNANAAPHMVLEELGQKYDLVLVDRTMNAQKSKDYLKINPNGRIPTLVDAELVLFEAAAIVLHLVDRHPEAGLAPEVGP